MVNYWWERQKYIDEGVFQEYAFVQVVDKADVGYSAVGYEFFYEHITYSFYIPRFTIWSILFFSKFGKTTF
jgi:hypothetical protein